MSEAFGRSPEERHAHDLKTETDNINEFKRLAKKLAEASVPVWNFGDGYGGYVKGYLDLEFMAVGLHLEPEASIGSYKKKPIPNALRKKVFERDAYRCVRCQSHIDLCADHRHPESLGGEATLENMQTLCRRCNTLKGARLEDT